jgi:hypothetical protein
VAKVNVYIDGFTLYYGALKGTPYKWLDLVRLCRALLPDTLKVSRHTNKKELRFNARTESCVHRQR